MDFLCLSMRRTLLATATTFVLCLPLAAFGQPTPASTGNTSDPRVDSLIERLSRVHTLNSAAISPDGNYVAWSVNGIHGSELHLTGIAPAEAAQDASWDRVISPDTIADVTRGKAGECKGTSPAWSPNGSQLAFLSNCSDTDGKLQPTPQQNVFVWTLASNAMKQVSHLHGELSYLQWSPDGKAIAFLFVENATREAGATSAMKPWNGVIGEDGIEVQRVYGINLSKTTGDWLTPSNLHVYEFSWAPDSSGLVFVAANPPGENNWWVAQLYTQNLAGSPTSILDPQKVSGSLHGLQIAVPRFSPDGKQIAFIGGLMSDQGATGGDVYVIPVSGVPSGGEPKNVTANRPSSPAYIAWLDDHTIGITEHVGGSSHVTALDLATGKDAPRLDLTLAESIFSDDDSLSVSFARNSSSIALIRQSYERAPEVWAGPIDNLKQLSHVNDSLKPAWGKAQSIEYTNGGFHIQGWLLYPVGWSPSDATNGKKYPLIVGVHGGPSSAVTPRWPSASYGTTAFSALGYFVFLPNPRGSYGQGERFTQANVKDFGHGDLSDILAGMDVIERRFPIDKNREGLTGWSYGGFMTMFGVTQTVRFRAALAGAGISNWQSYYGENSIDQWLLPFFGASVYDDPGVYAKSSPVNYIKNVKTPTLMIVGDRDGECPAPQSFEFWHALRDEGIKTQLVIYPGEGHHIAVREHQRDLLRRTIGWFEAEMSSK